MAEQVAYPEYAERVKYAMKYHLNREVKRCQRSCRILQFYTKGFKLYFLALLVFSILLGLIETFQIVLLYPILNASFNITDAGIPFFEPMYNVVRSVIDLPEVVTFCLLFIVFVILTLRQQDVLRCSSHCEIWTQSLTDFDRGRLR